MSKTMVMLYERAPIAREGLRLFLEKISLRYMEVATLDEAREIIQAKTCTILIFSISLREREEINKDLLLAYHCFQRGYKVIILGEEEDNPSQTEMAFVNRLAPNSQEILKQTIEKLSK